METCATNEEVISLVSNGKQHKSNWSGICLAFTDLNVKDSRMRCNWHSFCSLYTWFRLTFHKVSYSIWQPTMHHSIYYTIYCTSKASRCSHFNIMRYSDSFKMLVSTDYWYHNDIMFFLSINRHVIFMGSWTWHYFIIHLEWASDGADFECEWHKTAACFSPMDTP